MEMNAYLEENLADIKNPHNEGNPFPKILTAGGASDFQRLRARKDASQRRAALNGS